MNRTSDEVDTTQLPLRAQHHVIGNGMRMTFNGDIRLDEKWRAELNAESLRLFVQRAGWLNRKLGYE